MRNNDRDSFTSMKQEDNRYGESFQKHHTAKDHNKKEKHVKKYQNLRPEDLLEEDTDYEYDDGYQSAE